MSLQGHGIEWISVEDWMDHGIGLKLPPEVRSIYGVLETLISNAEMKVKFALAFSQGYTTSEG